MKFDLVIPYFSLKIKSFPSKLRFHLSVNYNRIWWVKTTERKARLSGSKSLTLWHLPLDSQLLKIF